MKSRSNGAGRGGRKCPPHFTGVTMAYTRTRMYGNVAIPSATRVRALRCGSPKCKAVHLIGMDEEHEPLFEIVLSKETHESIVKLFEEM